MNKDLATLLADIRRNPQNYQKYACLCDKVIWDKMVEWVTEFDLNQLEQLQFTLCKACPPKGEGGKVVTPTTVPVTPPPVVVPPPPPPIITVACSTTIPVSGQRR